MDLKIDFEGRDLSQTPQGWCMPISGAEEIAQRIHLRLCIPKGRFRLDPDLGSRLYSLSRGSARQMSEQAREIIEEAISPMAGVRLLEASCRYSPEEDSAAIACRFSWNGQELDMTMEV